MKLGLQLGYSGAGIHIPMDMILEAERLGYDSVWTSESYGSDAVTPASWVLAQTSRIKVGTAIMQAPARAPTMTAMTALTLQHLSGGRFILGIGPSGPQVVEGWYGASYARPLTRMREYIGIIRQVLARQQAVRHDGYHYQIPYAGADGAGLGKPLKSILHGDARLKIYTAAITYGGVELAAELADGFFPVWMNPQRFDLFSTAIESGFAKAAEPKKLADFEIAPFVSVVMGDDIDKCRTEVKQRLALYVGGMGAAKKNFYKDYTCALGYEEAAHKIQALFLAGQKAEAAASVPDAYVDDVALVGPADHIRRQLAPWREAGERHHVSAMLISGNSRAALRLLAEELL